MAYIKKKKNGSYLITVSCGRDEEDNKISKSCTFKPDPLTDKGRPKSEKTLDREAEVFARKFEENILTGSYSDGRTITVREFSEKYMSEYAPYNLSARSLDYYQKHIKRFNKDFGFMTLTSLSPMFLQEYANKMLHEKQANRSGKLVSAATVKQRMGVLSSMLGVAKRWNLIPQNPMDCIQIKPLEKTKKKLTFFTEEQTKKFLDILDNPMTFDYHRPHKAKTDSTKTVINIQNYSQQHQLQDQLKLFFQLAVFTGCRRGELLALQWSDLDMKKNMLSISKSVCRVQGKVIIKEPKTESSNRKIYLPQVVIDNAKAWKIKQDRYRLQIGSKWVGNDHVFIQWDGSIMGLETPYNAFQRLIDNYNESRRPDEIELPKIPLHGLRHTAATLLLTNHIDYETVAGMLGHASASTTLDIYGHYVDEVSKQASDTLASVLNPSKFKDRNSRTS